MLFRSRIAPPAFPLFHRLFKPFHTKQCHSVQFPLVVEGYQHFKASALITRAQHNTIIPLKLECKLQLAEDCRRRTSSSESVLFCSIFDLTVYSDESARLTGKERKLEWEATWHVHTSNRDQTNTHTIGPCTH